MDDAGADMVVQWFAEIGEILTVSLVYSRRAYYNSFSPVGKNW